MHIGPKYKIARRLGASVFEKTQTQKFHAHLERKGVKKGMSKAKSEYGQQFNEKQKVRFTYGVTEKQFAKYVKEALLKKSASVTNSIFESLELRLDNVLYRAGFAPTRLGGRQMASHGHVLVNGKKSTIPSMRLSVGDVITPRLGSKDNALFVKALARFENITTPSWLSVDIHKKQIEVTGMPHLVPSEQMFDLNAVVEFYSR